MANYTVLDITADTKGGTIVFKRVALTKANFNTKDLLGLWDPLGAIMNINEQITSVPPAIGTITLLNSADSNAPTTISADPANPALSKKYFRVRNNNERLINGPVRPNGNHIVGLSDDGFTIGFTFKFDALPIDTNDGIFLMGGYTILITPTAIMQVRYGSFILGTYAFPAGTSLNTWVMVLTIDVPTTKVGLFMNGVKIIDATAAAIVSPNSGTPAATTFLASANNSGRAIAGRYSQILVYKKPITDAEALQVSTMLQETYE